MIINNATLLAQTQTEQIQFSNIFGWIVLVAAFLVFLTGCIQLVSFGRGLQFQKESLKAQIKIQRNTTTREFNKMYDEIRFELSQRVINGQYNYEEYVLRFWNLQLDQYLSWIQGYIPDITYEVWMKNLRTAYQDAQEKEKLYKGESYRYGYQVAKKEFQEQAESFFEFLDKVQTEKDTPVKEIMKQQRNNPQIEQELKQQEENLENRLLSEEFATI